MNDLCMDVSICDPEINSKPILAVKISRITLKTYLGNR